MDASLKQNGIKKRANVVHSNVFIGEHVPKYICNAHYTSRRQLKSNNMPLHKNKLYLIRCSVFFYCLFVRQLLSGGGQTTTTTTNAQSPVPTNPSGAVSSKYHCIYLAINDSKSVQIRATINIAQLSNFVKHIIDYWILLLLWFRCSCVYFIGRIGSCWCHQCTVH